MGGDVVNQDDFLGSLSGEEEADLRAGARRRVFRRGTTLFNEGETSDRVALVETGRVKISYFTDDGREVVLAVRGAGSLLGELSALDDEPRSATATALDQVEALVLGSEDFRQFLARHPTASIRLLKTLARRLRQSDRRRIEFAEQDTVGRVARRLVELVEEFGEECPEGVRVALALTQEELAGWTGSSREAVSRALHAFRSRGWITTHRRAITVHDVDALRRRAS